MPAADPPTGPSPPPDSRPGRPAVGGGRSRTAARACTAALRTLYVGTALLGLLITPPLVTLVVAPVLAVGTAGALASFLWYVEGRWPSRTTLRTTGTATAALLPFSYAVQALQAVGDAVVLAVLALLVVGAVDAVRGRGGGRSPFPVPPGPGGDEDRLRELVSALPVQHLLAQWQALQRPRPGSDPAAAAAVRTVLLDELQRRDPDGFAAWLGTGAVGPPDEHVRSDRGSPP